MLRIADTHTPLIGKLCKPTQFGVELEQEYQRLFGVGDYNKLMGIYHLCNRGGEYEMALMFIDEKPEVRNGLTWYCLKEVGKGVFGDWHWLTLDQIMLCN